MRTETELITFFLVENVPRAARKFWILMTVSNKFSMKMSTTKIALVGDRFSIKSKVGRKRAGCLDVLRTYGNVYFVPVVYFTSQPCTTTLWLSQLFGVKNHVFLTKNGKMRNLFFSVKNSFPSENISP